MSDGLKILSKYGTSNKKQEETNMPRIYATTNPEKSEREVRNEQKVRRIAAEGMVLLENNGALPINADGRIALYGGGARKTVKGGTGSGDVNVRAFSTVEQGLEDAGFTVLTKGWLDKFDEAAQAAEVEKQRQAEEIKAQNLGFEKTVLQVAALDGWAVVPPAIEAEDIAADCDTAVYVLARNSGEGLDRRAAAGDFLLYEEEKENLRTLTGAYKQVIVVLNVGGVVDTRFFRELAGVGAILLMSQGGCMSGHSLADVLTGKTTPSGHLTTTWAEKYEDYPSATTFAACNGNLDDEYYTEGIFVGYRYFDSFGVKPAYPFGYGLSYTTFDIQTRGVRLDGAEVAAAVTVTNTGEKFAGKAVVQLYVSAPSGALEKPYQVLATYAKTKELAPGESEALTLTFPVEAMASYSEAKAAWVLEAGTYYVRVGAHSRDTHVAAALRLETELVTQRLSNCFHPDNTVQELSARDASACIQESRRFSAPAQWAAPPLRFWRRGASATWCCPTAQPVCASTLSFCPTAAAMWLTGRRVQCCREWAYPTYQARIAGQLMASVIISTPRQSPLPHCWPRRGTWTPLKRQVPSWARKWRSLASICGFHQP